MGVDSKVYIENIKARDIYKILSYFDKDYKIRDTGIAMGYFVATFTYFDEGRMLHIHETKIDIEASVKKYGSRNVDAVYYVEDGLPDKSWGVMMSLGYWGEQETILRAMCEMYGGWYDYSDTDDKSYIRINKTKNVFHRIIKRAFK